MVLHKQFGKISFGENIDLSTTYFLHWINLTPKFSLDENFFEKYIYNLDKIVSLFSSEDDSIKLKKNNYFIDGNVWIDKGVIIKHGTTIEGPVIIGKNSIIGPNAYVRPGTIIGQNVRIGFCAEINASIMFDGVQMRHFSYVGKSIIGESTKIGAGSIFATMRHDDNFIKIKTPNLSIMTKLHKLGSFVEHGTRIGVNSSIMPGSWLKSGIIMPSSSIKGLV